MAASRSFTLWDGNVSDSLKLLSGLLYKFGGIIDFTDSDLAEGQLSDGLCKTMDSVVFDRSSFDIAL